MRIGTVDARAAFIGDNVYEDLETASGGRFGPNALQMLDRWDEFRTWATETSTSRNWVALDPTRLGPPVPTPRQVFALAVNYKDHAAEAAVEAPPFPIVFTKWPSCICGPFTDVVLPSNRADWEVELVIVIGRTASKVNRDTAWSHVAGVTVGQDISERRVQFRKPGNHMDLAKSFPTFGPTGPWLVTTDELANPDDLGLTCLINGEGMQNGRTRDLIFPVAELIESISSMVTLLPGDLIFTGTPSGVGSTRDPRQYLAPGDVITSEIEGIGIISNRCIGPN
jgi:2,4-didehydro-3-deoxy-L-rhamnonate hydrolase